MIDELEQGKIVQFGELGNFQIGVRSEGIPLTKEVSGYSVFCTSEFRPSKRSRKMLKTLEFKLKAS